MARRQRYRRMTQRPRKVAGSMNKLVLIAGGSTLVYAVLAMLMGVLPGIEVVEYCRPVPESTR